MQKLSFVPKIFLWSKTLSHTDQVKTLETTNNISLPLKVLIRLLLAITIVFVLIVTRQLLVPLFFAVLFAYALYPAATKLESAGLPRILTTFFLIFTTVLVLAGSIYGVVLLVASFTENLPQVREQLTENIKAFQQSVQYAIGISESRMDSITESMQESGQYVGQFFTATANTILIVGLIPVYTFLMLFYRNKFREFVSMTSASKHKNIVQKIVDQAAEVVPKYMKGLFIVCLILMVVNSTGFYLIGVEYALLMGVIAALFNLIPYLGTVLGYGLVFIFVLVAQSPTIALYVGILFFIVQFFENNILTPNITGSYVKINPLVTIFSLVGGGMIWGLPGMFMIIPYLAILKIVCENVPSLQPVGFLLGTRGTEKHLISMEAIREKFGW